MNEWKKVKIGDVCEIIKGATGIASAEPGEYPLVVTAVERKTCSSFQFDCEAVCIPLVSSSGHGKKSLKNVHYQSGKFALGTILCAVIPNDSNELDARFLRQYLQFYKDIILVPLMKGAANVSLSMKDIATVEIPLPPIEKQRELSELFVSLQEKEKILNEEYEKQFEYTKQLRQNILQDAIEGRLTEEWRKNNPVVKGNPDFDAEALFEKIQEEKCHTDSELLRNSKKKEKSLPEITEDEKPFEIPEGWKWVRLGEIVYSVVYGTSSKCSYDSNQNSAILRIPNISLGYVDVSDLKYTNLSEIEKNELSLKENDLLVIRSNGSPEIVGKMVYVPKKFENYCYAGYLIRLRFTIPSIGFYIGNISNAKSLRNQIEEPLRSTVGINNINSDEIKYLIFSLPPLAEQAEIVSRVEKLLANVTELENQITEREEMTKQLMQSIMKDAFREV
ncbi:MAG: restriction endonuclease subunit S [Spirochaetaceae bacterium]|nr:restriction endonuclease subunit S [Spirochaetaceae bacterium]MBR6583799.1 restriction endonuclease subunit S [Treponema sp.]